MNDFPIGIYRLHGIGRFIIRPDIARCKLGEKLTLAITEPLEKLITDVPDNLVRTGRIRFIQEMLPAVTQVFAENNDLEITIRNLIDRLCYLNLSSVLFYKAYCRLITEDIGKEPKSKNLRLQLLHEHFLNLPVQQHLAYKANARTITTWIAG